MTCGSVIKVQHSATGALLHSHDITYGSGSGQQSVTGFAGGDDANSYWIVRGPEVGPGLLVLLHKQLAALPKEAARTAPSCLRMPCARCWRQ